MRLTVERGAVVPRLWRYEVRNALTVNERRGPLTAQQARATLADLSAMRFVLDLEFDAWPYGAQSSSSAAGMVSSEVRYSGPSEGR